MISVDIGFYTDRYLLGREARLNEKNFGYYARLAGSEFKRYIGEKDTSSYEDEVSFCLCELAEVLYKYDKATENTAEVSSESVGGWSRHYKSSEEIRQECAKEIKAAVYRNLCGTPLLFRGL